MKIAYILRGPYGVLGGSASYMIPAYMLPHADVRVLSYTSPGSVEKIVYTDSKVEIVDIYSDKEDQMLFNTYKALNAFKPDIVHVFQSQRCLLYFKSLCPLFPQTKWVLDIRTQIISSDKFRKKAMRRIFFYSQFFVDYVFGQSKHTISSSLPVRLRRYSEVPIGLKMSNFLPVTRETRVPIKFIFVGLIAKERQLDILLEAFDVFQKQGHKNCTLDLVGGGKDVRNLQLLMSQRGMKNINFLGVKTQKEVNQLMGLYDIGIAYIPNGVYEWAPSLKSIEYAASGLPILASDTKGHRDYEDRFGFQFNYFTNSVDGICEALETISNRDTFDGEINNNLERARRFDWENIISVDVLPVYKKLLSN